MNPKKKPNVWVRAPTPTRIKASKLSLSARRERKTRKAPPQRYTNTRHRHTTKRKAYAGQEEDKGKVRAEKTRGKNSSTTKKR